MIFPGKCKRLSMFLPKKCIGKDEKDVCSVDLVHDDRPDADRQADKHGEGEGDDQDDVTGHVGVSPPHLDVGQLLDSVGGRRDVVTVQKGLAVFTVFRVAPVPSSTIP